jgi:hypothetical protein
MNGATTAETLSTETLSTGAIARALIDFSPPARAIVAPGRITMASATMNGKNAAVQTAN